MPYFPYFLLVYGMLFITIVVYSLAFANDSTKRSLAQVLYVTASNLRGQRSLYENGWFIVSSSRKALFSAKIYSISATKRAVSQARTAIAAYAARYRTMIRETARGSAKLVRNTYTGGTKLSTRALRFTKLLVQWEWRHAADAAQHSWRFLLKENWMFMQRTAGERVAVVALPRGWYQSIRNDVANVRAIARSLTAKLFPQVAAHWGPFFAEAKRSFDESYADSGNCSNSIVGLANVLIGYGKAAYYGVFKPGARTLILAGRGIIKIALRVVIFPVGLVLIVCARTLQSTGLGLYYVAIVGAKLVYPTIASCLFAGLSLVLYSVIPATGIAGGLITAVNQVTIIVLGPISGAGFLLLAGAAITIWYVVRISLLLIKATLHIIFNQLRSIVVLAYNVLTALPTQLLLAAMNIIVLLSYDTPRLVAASVKGQVAWRNGG